MISRKVVLKPDQLIWILEGSSMSSSSKSHSKLFAHSKSAWWYLQTQRRCGGILVIVYRGCMGDNQKGKWKWLSSQQRVTTRKEADILILTTESDNQTGNWYTYPHNRGWQPERKLKVVILTTEVDNQKGSWRRIWLSLFVVIFLSGCHPWTLYRLLPG